jgi:hypothetical protein
LRRVENLPRMRLLLRLLAKTAARRCIVVLYYAMPAIGVKARLKSPLSASCHFPEQIDRRVVVKHSCCAQWIARGGDFLGILARAGAAN